MSIYREKQTGSDDTSAVETIRAGCPICKTDVKGNDIYLFFCKKCNILFKREELLLSKEHVERLIQKAVVNSSTKTPLRLGEEKIREKPLKVITYIGSAKSKMVHANNCPYAKNIKEKLRFKTLLEAKDFKRCKCIE